MTKPSTVDSYIANSREEAHQTLEELRKVITSRILEAEEGISYNVPFYKFYGVHVGFSAFKSHATFGIGADVFQDKERKMFEEKGYKTVKETIQIRYNQKVPDKYIKQLLKAKVSKAKRTMN